MGIGWNLFHAIATAADSVVGRFGHIVDDAGAAAEHIASRLGIQTNGQAVVALLMGSHAGHPEAVRHERAVLERGGNWPALLKQTAKAIKAHPDFAQFHREAKLGMVRAKVTGFIAPPTGARRSTPGPLMQNLVPRGMTRPAAPPPRDTSAPDPSQDASQPSPGYYGDTGPGPQQSSETYYDDGSDYGG